MRAASAGVRAYFAPVKRAANTPTVFNPAASGSFDLSAPPAPWISLGAIAEFKRNALTEVEPIATGAKGSTRVQARLKLGAEVSFEFREWGKLQMALACGSQQMNLLAEAEDAAPRASGGAAAPAIALQPGSTATELVLDSASLAQFAAGEMVAVDIDYTGQVGYVGSGVAAAYVKSAVSVGSNVDYIRRVTFNVGRVKTKTASVLQLEQPLIGGVPESGAKLQKVIGFVDRESGSFFQEWSAVFVCDSESGGRVVYHYPRLQAAITAEESAVEIAKPWTAWSLKARFRAMPVLDPIDGEEVLSFRSWIPGSVAPIY
jgi:hypothetical protein